MLISVVRMNNIFIYKYFKLVHWMYLLMEEVLYLTCMSDKQEIVQRNMQNCHPRFPEGRVWPVKEVGWRIPLGGNPEGQRSPGSLDTLQEGNLQGGGAGCPHVLKDEKEGKHSDKR